jgi:purine-cytosine permease-like protein
VAEAVAGVGPGGSFYVPASTTGVALCDELRAPLRRPPQRGEDDVMVTQQAAGPPLETSPDDDPRALAEAASEDFSLHVVPHTWRMDRGKLTLAWWGVATAFFYIYFAAFAALAWGTVNALIGLGLTVIVYSLVNWVMVRAASHSGLTVALFSRGMFGFVGASIATLIFAATCIYYWVFEGSVVSVAAKSLLGGPLKLWYAIVIVATIPLVWRGVRTWMDKFNGWMLPVFVIGMTAVIAWTLADKGYHGFLPAAKAAPGTTLPWLQVFSAYMGVWILMMFTFDFARLARPRDERYHVAVTFGFAYYVMTFLINGLIGILLVSSFGITFAGLAGKESALPVDIVNVTGIVGLLLIAITQFRINVVNAYLASTNLQSFFSRLFRLNLPRVFWLVVAGAIGYVLMLTNIFSYVNDALAYQGIAIVAWVSIALAHIGWRSLHHESLEQQEFRPGRIPAFNPGGIVAWGVATGVGLWMKIGLSATNQFFATWGLPITFGIAFVIYGASLVGARASWFAMSRPGDPALEVGDPWEVRVRCHRCERFFLAREMDRDPTAGHQAICAECATGQHFYIAARHEAQGTMPEPAPEASSL